MQYDPKIFIRGYGKPTYRLLANVGEITISGGDSRFIRDLIMQAENPSGSILLSGDEQTGSDQIQLSGISGQLSTSTDASLKIEFPNAALLRGLIANLEHSSIGIECGDAVFRRELLISVVSSSLLIQTPNADFKRDLIMHADPLELSLETPDSELHPGIAFNVDHFELTLEFPEPQFHRSVLLEAEPNALSLEVGSVDFTRELILCAEPLELSMVGQADLVHGTPADLLLVSGDEQAGNEHIIYSGDQYPDSIEISYFDDVLDAQPFALSIEAQPAEFLFTCPIALSGDSQSGSDEIILSGDAGPSKLMITEA